MNPNNHNQQFPAGENPPGWQPRRGQAPYDGPPASPQLPQPNQPYGPGPTQPYTPAGQQQSYNPYPEQQYPSQSADKQAQYDFIMGESNAWKQKATRSTPSVNSTPVRIVLAVVGLLLLIVIAGFITNYLNRPKTSTVELVSVLEEQTELVRVSNIATGSAQSAKAVNSTYNTKLSIANDKQQLLTYLVKTGIKIDPKSLGGKQSAKTDTALKNAQISNLFDGVYTGLMNTELQKYQTELKSAYNANPGPNGQKLLKEQYDHATLLLTQFPADTNSGN